MRFHNQHNWVLYVSDGKEEILENLNPQQINRIAEILAEKHTGSELGQYLAQCRIPDPNPNLSKTKRLYNAFAARANSDHSTNSVYQFILYCFDPAQGLSDPERYQAARLKINEVLMLVGVEVRDDGKLHKIQVAQNLSEVQRRTRDLRKKLTMFGVHHEVLVCCREEWLTADQKYLNNHVYKISSAATSKYNMLEQHAAREMIFAKEKEHLNDFLNK